MFIIKYTSKEVGVMFKKFVIALINCKDSKDVQFVTNEIDMAYQREEISYKDLELLLDLAVKVDPNIFRAGIVHIEKEA